MTIDNIIVAYIVWEVEVSLSQTTFTARPTARHNRRIIIQLKSSRISQIHWISITQAADQTTASILAHLNFTDTASCPIVIHRTCLVY